MNVLAVISSQSWSRLEFLRTSPIHGRETDEELFDRAVDDGRTVAVATNRASAAPASGDADRECDESIRQYRRPSRWPMPPRLRLARLPHALWRRAYIAPARRPDRSLPLGARVRLRRLLLAAALLLIPPQVLNGKAGRETGLFHLARAQAASGIARRPPAMKFCRASGIVRPRGSSTWRARKISGQRKAVANFAKAGRASASARRKAGSRSSLSLPLLARPTRETARPDFGDT